MSNKFEESSNETKVASTAFLTSADLVKNNKNKISSLYVDSVTKPRTIIISNKMGQIEVKQGHVPYDHEYVISVPELTANLSSVKRLEMMGINIIFEQEKAEFYKDGDLIVRGSRDDNLHKI
ncbi:hypothetical protein JTB14_021231 [Gonioctena quinquepunctata]|nr:hypothetical protein JTB14_021231 [Gonioctena quinquepunctata]